MSSPVPKVKTFATHRPASPCYSTHSTRCPRKCPTFDLMYVETTVFTMFALIFSESSYFNIKFCIMQSKIGSKFAEQWLKKAKISGPTQKMHLFKAAILIYQSSHEHKNFVNLKETQLFSFCCTKGLYQKRGRYRYYIFSCW